jgi:hypothetical protein
MQNKQDGFSLDKPFRHSKFVIRASSRRTRAGFGVASLKPRRIH